MVHFFFRDRSLIIRKTGSKMATVRRSTRAKASPRAAVSLVVHILLAAWVLCASSSPALALDPTKALSQYRHDRWGQEQGMPQNSVAALIESRSGYVWLGTQEGVVRFDGHRFRVFDRRNTPVMRSQVIGSLAEDHRGTIWVGTEDGLLCIRDDEVTLLHREEGLEDTAVRALLVQGQDVLIGTLETGLFRYRDGRITHFGDTLGLPRSPVWALAQSAGGPVWMGTNEGVVQIEGDTAQRFTTEEGLPHERVYAMTVTPQGEVFAGTRRGIAQFVEGRFQPLGAEAGLPEISIYSLIGDPKGTLWIGTNGEGLHRLDKDGRASAFKGAKNRAPLLVRSLTMDREGGLLIGTSGDGLQRLADGPITTWSQEEGLPGDKVYTVYEDRSGALWIGTFGQGLARFVDGRFETFTTDDGLASDLVWSLVEDRQGNLWVGTYGGGLSRLSPDGTWRTFGTEAGLSNLFIRHVMEDRQGDLWVGTKSGLHRLRGQSFERWGMDDGLPSSSIQVLMEDRKEGLWIGTNGGGLSHFVDGQFHNLGEDDGLASGEIYDFHQDDEGALWFGTEGGGLHRLKEGQLTVIGTRMGLADDLIYSLQEDDQGYFWMSSNHGITRVHKNELRAVADGLQERVECQFFDATDGMKSRETNGGSQPSSWKRQNGALVFPTLEGFVQVDPTDLGEPLELPPVLLEEVLADEEPLLATSGSFEVPATVDRLSFHFTAPSLHRPDELRFRYRLEGFDRDWVDAGIEHKAVYTRIPPGPYEMTVAVRAHGGNWGPPTRLSLTRLPHFHQTPAFLLACLGVLALFLWGLHRLRVHQLDSRRRELELEVKQAIEQIKVLHGILPICSGCKSIRDDRGAWSRLENYIQAHTEVEFTHGLCPECALKYYPDLDLGAPRLQQMMSRTESA